MIISIFSIIVTILVVCLFITYFKNNGDKIVLKGITRIGGCYFGITQDQEIHIYYKVRIGDIICCISTGDSSVSEMKLKNELIEYVRNDESKEITLRSFKYPLVRNSKFVKSIESEKDGTFWARNTRGDTVYNGKIFINDNKVYGKLCGGGGIMELSTDSLFDIYTVID